MPRKTFTVTVSASGAIAVEASGPGPECLDELDAIQQLIPKATIVDSRLTPAYHQVANQTIDARQSQHEADDQ